MNSRAATIYRELLHNIRPVLRFIRSSWAFKKSKQKLEFPDGEENLLRRTEQLSRRVFLFRAINSE